MEEKSQWFHVAKAHIQETSSRRKTVGKHDTVYLKRFYCSVFRMSYEMSSHTHSSLNASNESSIMFARLTDWSGLACFNQWLGERRYECRY